MPLETPLKLSDENNLNYQKLLSVIEASENTLSLLIAVCDDRRLRDKIIEAYEKELSPNIASYHSRLDQNEPSLRAAIYKIVHSEDFHKNQKNILLTITGAEDLLFIRNNGEKSQQDKFFGYLQWTREGLREFPYPIVLWVTNQILVNLSRKAPDFWSWRKGVFHFTPEPSLIPVSPPDNRVVSYDHLREDYSDSLSLEDLEELIANTEKKRGKNDPNLVTLYNNLGKTYFNRIRSGESVNFPDEKEKALHCYYQALDISREIGDRQGEGNSVQNLGFLYNYLAQYKQAIEYLQESLAIKREVGDHKGEACSYTGLGNVHNSLGQYKQAIEYHQKSLAITAKIGDRYGQASSYNNIGNVHNSLGEYEQAKQYYQKSLTIFIEIADLAKGQICKEIRQGEAYSYNNIGNACRSLGQYEQAIEYHQQSLTITREIGDRKGEANSYNNIGNAYRSLGQYEQAIEHYQQSLAITREIADRRGEAYSYINLGDAYCSLGQYQQAIKYYQQSLAITREIGDRYGEANTWLNLGLSFQNIQRNNEAIKAFQNAHQLYQDMGLNQMVEHCDNEINKLVSRD
ncbi:MAG: tetratricopeptide repeat protein [Crocosphaera sp.]|nr:tetratricopeptide repeat protein [Crocosphaera sp.]